MSPRTDDGDDAHDGFEDTLDDDDLPSTHLDDDAYEAFLARELDAGGRPRGDPPVGWIVLALVVVVLLVLTLLT